MDAARAHRAEQCGGHAAPTAGAHHEDVGVRGGAQKEAGLVGSALHVEVNVGHGSGDKLVDDFGEPPARDVLELGHRGDLDVVASSYCLVPDVPYLPHPHHS